MKRWLPIGICCLPGFAAALVAAGIVTVKGIQSMDVNTIFLLIVGLACPIGMGLMMWAMNRQMNQKAGGHRLEGEPSPQAGDRVALLRLQRQLLDEEIKQLEAQNAEVVTVATPIRAINHLAGQSESE